MTKRQTHLISFIYLCSCCTVVLCEMYIPSHFTLRPLAALALGGISAMAIVGIIGSSYWYLEYYRDKYHSNMLSKPRFWGVILILLFFSVVFGTIHDFINVTPFLANTGDAKVAIYAFLRLLF